MSKLPRKIYIVFANTILCIDDTIYCNLRLTLFADLLLLNVKCINVQSYYRRIIKKISNTIYFTNVIKSTFIP